MRKLISIILILLMLIQTPIWGIAEGNSSKEQTTKISTETHINDQNGNNNGSNDNKDNKGEGSTTSEENPEDSNVSIIISKVEPKTKKGEKINKIYADETFTLDITLEIYPKQTENLNIYVQLEKSDSFSPVGTGSRKKADPDNKNNDEKDKSIYTVTFDEIYYNGGENTTIPITISYDLNGKTRSISDYISITNISPSKEEDKKTEGDPNITIVSSKTISGQAGESLYVPITIKNSSDSWARNITVTAEIEGGSPIALRGSGHEDIYYLRGGKTEDIQFRVDIDEYAESKTYPIKINFQFYNSDGKSYTGSDTVYIKVENKNKKPLISIDKIDIKPEVSEADKPTKVGFQLINNGTLEARDIKISLGGIGNDTFTIASGLNSRYIDRISGGKTAYVEFEIIPSIKLPGGSHGLDLVLNYKDGTGQSYEDSSKFFVNVASNKGRGSNLIIENLIYPDGAVGHNKDVNIGFTLKNVGKMDAKNIKVSVESSDQAAIVPKTVSIKKIESLAPNQSERLSFIFLTTKDGETRNYPINITVEYEDDLTEGQEKHTLTQYVGVYIVKPGDDIKTTPKLIIDKYSFEPNLVRAGENFTMSLSFFNTNSQKAVRNIKIFLTAEEKTDPNSQSSGGNVFTPVGSSNTFYIDSIPPKGRVEKVITMFTVPDAKAKTHTVTANFEYEDSDGTQYTATELIGVPVVQQSKLEIGEISLPSEAFVGEAIPISVEFYNTGKVTLYNMMVKLEGNFQTEDSRYYIGNFEMGTSDYFEGTIIPEETGELTGYLVFTYEDSSGEVVEIREEFTLNVMEAMPMDESLEDMVPEEESKGFKGIWIALILIAASIGGFIFYKKKKEKGMALDE